MEARLVADAARFDLRPLIEQLAKANYPNEAILFEGASEGGGARLVKGLRFTKSPMRTAIVTLNMGLMGDAGLLPSYFTWIAEHSPESNRFWDFIRFFEHQLIDNLFHATHPEWGEPSVAVRDKQVAQERPSVLGDAPDFLRTILRIANPATPSTLHWLAQMCFPEFAVRVVRHSLHDATDAYACRLGESRLDGTGILGREYKASLAGFIVELTAEDEVDMREREQVDVALARLRSHLLPILAPFRMPLIVRLTILWHSSFARVDGRDDDDPSFLGYNRLGGDRDVRHTTVIYSGITGRDGPWSEDA